MHFTSSLSAAIVWCVFFAAAGSVTFLLTIRDRTKDPEGTDPVKVFSFGLAATLTLMGLATIAANMLAAAAPSA